MLKVIVQSEEINKYQQQLLGLLKENGRQIENVKAGHKGGNIPDTAWWLPEQRLWLMTGKEENRHWNAFGTDEPAPGRNVTITCEINIPLSGINKQIGGAFASDNESQIWLIHRGIIGGGRKGIGPELVRNYYKGPWEEIDNLNGTISKALPIGNLNSNNFLDDLANFIREIDRIKHLSQDISLVDDEPIEHGRTWWWVNQNKTFKQEHAGGYVWAPKKTKGGGEAFHHVNVGKVKQGDVIWHYCNQMIVSISIAKTDAFEQAKPAELETDEWETDGYMVKVQYFDLPKPIHRDSIPIELRTALSRERRSPFNRGGTVNQGYLFALTNKFVTELIYQFPQLLPDGVNAPEEDSQNATSNLQESLFIELRDKLRNLNVNRDYGSIKRYKPGIVLAVLESLTENEPINEINFEEIVPGFRSVMQRYGIKAGTTQAEEAFFRLDKDGIWHYVSELDEDFSGLEPARLRKVINYAQFPDRYWTVIRDPDYREQLQQDIIDTWFSQNDDSIEPVPVEQFSRQKALQILVTDIASDGYYFEPWQVAAYVTALRTKPFVILAGVSGSGKSRLPQLVAKITGGESRVIPVKPDWTDSSDILGYVQLKGRLNPGKLLRLAAEAIDEPNLSWCAIIDEMNIARVEHYFAEVLSLIEQSRSDDEKLHPLLGSHLEHEEDAKWSRVGLPSNLAIVGTVNMDESTHGFSKKVLDRAFTLEFSEINLEQWDLRERTEYQSKAWPITAWRPRARKLAALTDLTQSEREIIDDTIKTLVTLNEILSQAQIQLAYRSRNEIVLFVLHANEVREQFVDSAGKYVDPIDLAVQMKVLPRIAGGSATVKTLLRELLGFSKNGDRNFTDDQASDIVSAWINDRKPTSIKDANLPRTCARVCLMWHRFTHEGYTSYWL